MAFYSSCSIFLLFSFLTSWSLRLPVEIFSTWISFRKKLYVVDLESNEVVLYILQNEANVKLVSYVNKNHIFQVPTGLRCKNSNSRAFGW